MNPHPLTLRELVWMATGRQRADWQRVGVMVAWIVNKSGMVKRPVEPNEVIPEQFRGDGNQRREPTEEEKAMRRRRFWSVVDNAAKKV